MESLSKEDVMLTMLLASTLITSFILPSYALEINDQNYFSNDYNVYSLSYKEFEYNIPYKISGSDIKNIVLDCSSNNLLINIQHSDDGILEINMPRKCLKQR